MKGFEAPFNLSECISLANLASTKIVEVNYLKYYYWN